MSFCPNCGTKLNEGNLFCSNCGTKVVSIPIEPLQQAQPEQAAQAEQLLYTNQQDQPTQPPQTTQQVQPTQATTYYEQATSNKKFKLSTAKKVIIGIVAGVIILCIAAFQIGASITSKDKVIEKFNTALKNGDSKQLVSMLKSSDSKVEINEKNVKSLLNYLKKDPTYITDLMNSIKDQSENLDKKIVTEYKDAITLKKSGKKFFFYDNYVFEVLPVYIEVSINTKDAEIYVNDTKVCTSDSEDFTKKVGPFFPGTYKVKAVYKGKYTSIQDSEEVEGFKSNNYYYEKQSTYLDIDKNYVQIDCNQTGDDFYFGKDSDAKVFVNGKDTGMIIKQINENENGRGLGPVDNNTKIYVEKTYPWGSVKSKEVNVNVDEYEVTLDIEGLSDDIKNSIITTISEYEKSLIVAATAKDPSKLVNGSQALIDDVTDFINSYKDGNSTFSASILKTEFDLDSFSIEEDSGIYSVYVTARSTRDFPLNPTAEKVQIAKYKLSYNSQGSKWIVEQVYSDYSIGSNIKTVTY